MNTKNHNILCFHKSVPQYVVVEENMAELDPMAVSTHRFKGASMKTPKPKTDSILEDVGHELKVNEPRVVSLTRKKFGPARALAQSRAILLSKARRAGAQIPQPKGLNS